ncbi:MAG: ribonuclease HI family protein [Rubrobacteridae bacterium]|nr:ribonuclease HI family protein [Rubrobacteridae bacterium]
MVSTQVHEKIIIYSDGAARGNPGHAGAGASIQTSTGEVISEVSEYLRETTNNVAEYRALILALEQARPLGACELEVRADSELMVKQLNGLYKVKNEGLKPLHAKVNELLLPYRKAKIIHVYRSDNKRADELANEAIDEYRENRDSDCDSVGKNISTENDNEYPADYTANRNNSDGNPVIGEQGTLGSNTKLSRRLLCVNNNIKKILNIFEILNT